MAQIGAQSCQISESGNAVHEHAPAPAKPAMGVPYIRELDGLRAISIMLVLAAHLNYLANGAIGVDIFFVISGYLITSVLLNEFSRTGKISIVSFYYRRVLRIVPAFAVLLACYVAAIAFGASPETKAQQYLAALFAATYTMNWARVLGQGSGIIGHTWSLAVEEQFYLIWPVILIGIAALSRWKQLLLIIGVIVVSTLWRGWLTLQAGTADHVFFGSDTRANELFVGCLLAFLPMSKLAGRARKTWVIPVMLLLIFAATDVAWHVEFVDSLIVSASAAWLIAAMHGRDEWALTPILAADVSVAIGRLSYSLYLWHLPIISLVFSKISGTPKILELIATALSLGAAALSYFFVEGPFLRLKRRFSNSNPGVVGL